MNIRVVIDFPIEYAHKKNVLYVQSTFFTYIYHLIDTADLQIKEKVLPIYRE